MKKVMLLSVLMTSMSVGYTQQDSAIAKYIEKYKDIAVSEKERTGIPAAITLGQAILESTHGTSELAQKSNNHFGIKCQKNWLGKTVFHDDDRRGECFRAYENVEGSYVDHSYILTTRPWYARLFKLKKTDYRGWAKGLKKAGYATDPGYAKKLISNIEKYKLFMFDHEESNITPTQ